LKLERDDLHNSVNRCGFALPASGWRRSKYILMEFSVFVAGPTCEIRARQQFYVAAEFKTTKDQKPNWSVSRDASLQSKRFIRTTKESLKARGSPATLIDEAATSQDNWKTVAGGIGCGLWFIALSSAFVSKGTNASHTASGFQPDWKAIAAGIGRGLGFAVSCVMLLGWVFVAHEKVVALDTESGGQDDWKTVAAGIGRGLGFVLSCLMLQTSVFIADEGTDAAHTMAGWMALQSMALMVAFFVGHVPSILADITVFATYWFLCSMVPDDHGLTFVAWFPTCVAIIINTCVIGYAIKDSAFSTQRDSNQPVV
jgi:hypothetical protein